MMERVEVLGVHLDTGSGSTVVLLGPTAEPTTEPTRVLPIFAGGAEGQAIAVGLQGIDLPRPGTHDVIVDLLDRLGASLGSITVTELRGSTFFAEMTLDRAGEEILLSVRPSDAIAVALRTGAPVFVVSDVLVAAGVEVEHSPDDPLDEDEIVGIVAEFEAFLERAEPADFVAPEGDAEED